MVIKSHHFRHNLDLSNKGYKFKKKDLVQLREVLKNGPFANCVGDSQLPRG